MVQTRIHGEIPTLKKDQSRDSTVEACTLTWNLFSVLKGLPKYKKGFTAPSFEEDERPEAAKMFDSSI